MQAPGLRGLAAVDPRARLLSCLAVVFVFALLTRVDAALLALVTALVWRSTQPFGKGFASRLASVNLFVALLWLVTPWTTPGETWWRWGWFTFTHEGVLLMALLTLKCNAIFLAFDAFLSRMSPTDLARGLMGLGCLAKLTTLLLLTARQIDGLKRIKDALEESARLRGFELRFSMHTYRTVAAFVRILMIRAYRKSRVLSEALELRGFNGTWPAVHFHRLSASDIAFTTVSAAVAVLVALCDATAFFGHAPSAAVFLSGALS